MDLTHQIETEKMVDRQENIYDSIEILEPFQTSALHNSFQMPVHQAFYKIKNVILTCEKKLDINSS
jgi:hypothetical protein